MSNILIAVLSLLIVFALVIGFGRANHEERDVEAEQKDFDVRK